MTLYDNIKKYAKLRGLSLQDVAEKAGLSKNMIYQYNRNKKPSLETLDKIAAVLSTTSKELLGNDRGDSAIKTPIPDFDLKKAMKNYPSALAWDGKPIPPEEMEMIRRILDGGK